jgi:hypothetical protein
MRAVPYHAALTSRTVVRKHPNFVIIVVRKLHQPLKGHSNMPCPFVAVMVAKIQNKWQNNQIQLAC